jgi:CheY-like chemotaxis protein
MARILAVDDEPSTLMMIEELLAGEHELAKASDGVPAMTRQARYKFRPPDAARRLAVTLARLGPRSPAWTCKSGFPRSNKWTPATW